MSSPGYDPYRRPSLLGSMNRSESPGPSVSTPSPYASRFAPGNVGQLGVATIPSMSISGVNPYRNVPSSSPVQHHGTLPLKAMLKENEIKRREDVKNKLM